MSVSDLVQQLTLGVISLIANTLSAFAGGGAGLVQLPALILLGLPFAKALATHKIASVALGLGAASRHFRAGSLHLKLSLLVLLSGLPGVWIGANVVLRLPDQWATIALGVLTIGLGLYSAKRPDLGADDAIRPLDRRTSLIGSIVLFAIGVLNGSLTSGTGLFVTLWLVHWFRIGFTRAVAHTLILVGLCWNGTGAVVLGISGEIQWAWLPMLIAGSLLGGYIGAHLSISRGNRMVKSVFEWLALVMGTSLLIRSF